MTSTKQLTMQVTGSNSNKNTSSRLSIRIPSGQSLHRGQLSQEFEGGEIALTIEGCGVVPFPREVAERLDLEALMLAAGVALAPTDRIVTTSHGGSIEYAIRFSEESSEIVGEWQAKGYKVSYDTPLSGVCRRAIVGTRRPKTVVLRIEEGTCYVALSEEKRVCYLEALPIAGTEELINLLALLNRDYELRKARFVLLGKESATYRKTIRGYFRRVSCEE